MAISYVLVARKNPLSPESGKKFYATAQSTGDVSFNRLAEEVMRSTSSTKGDVQLALDALISSMVSHLSNGEIIRLGDFGSFRMSISSKGATDSKDFSTALILKSRIAFAPGESLKAMINNLKYQKYVPAAGGTPIEPEAPEQEA